MRFTLLLIASLGLVAAENGLNGWLRYAPLPNANRYYSNLPSSIVTLNNTQTSPVYTAGLELQRGLQGIFGKQVDINSKKSESSVVIGTVDEYTKAYGKPKLPSLIEDGFWLSTKGDGVQIIGQNERGVLYGAFEYLSMLALGNFSKVAYATNPHAPIRWVNQWDNLDGSIERGYGGSSIFFNSGVVVNNLT
jgi:alpha-glucuronidase